MQQRQPRLGDILDDYCPRERRLTNHVVVALVGDAVKQTRCTTCDADHEYKHAAVPRQRRKSEQATLYSQVLANVAPKRVTHVSGPDDLPDTDTDAPPESDNETVGADAADPSPEYAAAPAAGHPGDDSDAPFESDDDEVDGNRAQPVEEGPAHRRLIRAQLPRHEGQVSTARQAPDFTIRQPTTRPKRFGGPRHQPRGAHTQGNRPGGGVGNANGNARGGGPRQNHRPQNSSRPGHRPGGRNRPK